MSIIFLSLPESYRHALLSVPRLMAHYQEHHPGLNLRACVDFIRAHYGDDLPDHDHHPHEDLPFQQHHDQPTPVQSFNWMAASPARIVWTTAPVVFRSKLQDAGERPYMSRLAAEIWQPPRKHLV